MKILKLTNPEIKTIRSCLTLQLAVEADWVKGVAECANDDEHVHTDSLLTILTAYRKVLKISPAPQQEGESDGD